MTTLNQARTSVYKHFLAGWKDNSNAALTPYCFDNEEFLPPEDTEARPSAWVRCSVRSIAGGASTLGAVGNRKFKRAALVRIELYTAPGTGLKQVDGFLQKAVDLFECVHLDDLKMHDANTAEIGLIDDGLWFLSTTSISFEYEQIK